MEIILSKKEIKGIVKKYYKDYYNIKFCKVQMEANSIKDKLKEIDLFHSEDSYYNMRLNTKVTGLLVDRKGRNYRFESDLNEKSVSEIIKKHFASEYDLDNMKFEYSCSEDTWSNQRMKFYFEHARFDLNKKAIKMLTK